MQSASTVIGVIGLGYVGLPVATSFAKAYKVIGYDISQTRIRELKEGIDRNQEISPERLKNPNLTFSGEEKDLRKANFFIVTVPTPIDAYKVPDLTPIRQASYLLQKVLKKGDCVVYESTVYPGCTEEICIPILEETGLKAGEDFWVGYSPERINPGDPQHPFEKIPKIVSGIHSQATEFIYQVYQKVLEAPLHKAASIKTAEAAKVIENTQRDLNIALMNELALIFSRMGISFYDVLDAARTKWNFHPYTPGLVGGHCIGVDPYYLTYKATALGFHPQVILAGRGINDAMPTHLAQMLIEKLATLQKPHPWRVLILGFTFKENVPDIRNTKVFDMVQRFQAHNIHVDVIDPLADPEEVREHYGLALLAKPQPPYDMIICAVAHDAYKKLTEKDFLAWVRLPSIVADIKGIYRCQLHHENLLYWTL
ncbi:MAG: nucleotide sugar dehydrogenase [Bacteroidia bacterium]